MKVRLSVLGLILALLLAQGGCAWNQKTVTVGGQTVVVDSSVPGSTLDAENFSRRKDGTIAYSGGKYLTGIDVSAHQGKINWKKVAEKVDFAMIVWGTAATQRGCWRRTTPLCTNIKHALKNGLQVGVYFFSQAVSPKEAVEEAEYLRHESKNIISH